MWIVAGPNGSGKTTLTRSRRVKSRIGTYQYLCADDVAKALKEQDLSLGDREASLIAANKVDQDVLDYISGHQSFVVETVLSSPKYKKMVKLARSQGFQIGLIFVYTPDPLLNVLRVRTRVAMGGHPVAAEDIKKRWPRSIRNFGWFANRAERILLIDSTTPRGRTILVKHQHSRCIQKADAGHSLMNEVIANAQAAVDRLQG